MWNYFPSLILSLWPIILLWLHLGRVVGHELKITEGKQFHAYHIMLYLYIILFIEVWFFVLHHVHAALAFDRTNKFGQPNKHCPIVYSIIDLVHLNQPEQIADYSNTNSHLVTQVWDKLRTWSLVTIHKHSSIES